MQKERISFGSRFSQEERAEEFSDSKTFWPKYPTLLWSKGAEGQAAMSDSLNLMILSRLMISICLLSGQQQQKATAGVGHRLWKSRQRGSVCWTSGNGTHMRDRVSFGTHQAWGIHIFDPPFYPIPVSHSPFLNYSSVCLNFWAKQICVLAKLLQH